jgi:hypothetical protein
MDIDEIVTKEAGVYKYVVMSIDGKESIVYDQASKMHVKIALDFFKSRGEEKKILEVMLTARSLGILGGGEVEWNGSRLVFYAGSSFGPNGSDPEQEEVMRKSIESCFRNSDIAYDAPLTILQQKGGYAGPHLNQSVL